MDKQLLHAGAQTSSWEITIPSSGLVNMDEDDWALLPSGALRDLLLRKYASDLAFFEAAAAAGFQTSGLSVARDTLQGDIWGLWGSGYPGTSLICAGYEGLTAVITISCAYSVTE